MDSYLTTHIEDTTIIDPMFSITLLVNVHIISVCYTCPHISYRMNQFQEAD